MSAERKAEVVRHTTETQIRVALNLDGTGAAKLATGIGFFDHMLDQIARHGLIDLDIDAKGDLHIDGHHTVEDVGITLGQAVAKAVGDKKGLRRYGHAYVPLDEALSSAPIMPLLKSTRMCSPGRPEKSMTNRDSASSSGT